MKFIQKIALKWYQTFDASGLMYGIIKDLNKPLRYLIYLAFPTALYFVLSLLGGIIDPLKFGLFSGNPYFLIALIFFGKLVLILAPLAASLIFTYETILELPIQEILKSAKEDKKYKKLHKLQWWRLRNMNLGMRIFVYAIFYYLILQIIKISIIGAVSNLNSINIDEIKAAYMTILAYTSFAYICIVLVVDYFASKKRR